jgi:hypothetical protein
MKYRIVKSIFDDSFDVISEDGGVVSIHHNGNGFVSTYYHGRLTDIMPKTLLNPEQYIWDFLSHFPQSMKDWEPFSEQDEAKWFQEMLQDALSFLVFPAPAEGWEEDDYLFVEFF